MRKLLTVVILSAILIVVLFVAAFYYVHRTGHVALVYEYYSGGKLSGKVFVDRYLTEDKLIYKAVSEYTGTDGYPELSQRLSFKRKTLSIIKYTAEATGIKGAKKTFSLAQKDGRIDLLYIEPPEYFVMDDFETGEPTLMYSPLDVMLSMPIADRYNFWKKGSQYFEVMVPLDAPLPVIRDKLEVRHEGGEYVPVMGERIDADVLFMKSEGLPGVRMKLSKYSHRVLSLETEDGKSRFILVSFPGGLIEEVPILIEKLKRAWSGVFEGGKVPPEDPVYGGEKAELVGPGEDMAPDAVPLKKEVFFKSSNQMLAGELSLPSGKGPFPGIVLVAEDGPMRMGTERLFDSLALSLANGGYAVFVFDFPGQGKSPGNFQALDDEDKVSIVTDAAKAASELPEVETENISIIGIRGGGYLALKALTRLPEISSSVAIDMPLLSVSENMDKGIDEDMLNSVLKKRAFGPFDEHYMKTVRSLLKAHLEDVKGSAGNKPFFMGESLPEKAYREYLEREPLQSIATLKKPFLLVLAKNSVNYRPLLVEDLRKEEDKGFLKMAVFRDFDEYLIKNGPGGEHVPDEDVLVVIKKWIEESSQKASESVEDAPLSEADEGVQ